MAVQVSAAIEDVANGPGILNAQFAPDAQNHLRCTSPLTHPTRQSVGNSYERPFCLYVTLYQVLAVITINLDADSFLKSLHF